MEIKSTQISSSNTNQQTTGSVNQTNNTDSQKFSDELKNISKTKNESEKEKSTDKNTEENKNLDGAIDGLQDAVKEINELNRTDENEEKTLKDNRLFDDNKIKREELGLIDNNMNIQEPKDKIDMQMGANMNFNSNGQPFAEFVNNQKSKDTLKNNIKELAEEQAIMSTMEENIAIANKNMALEKTKTVTNEHGVKKVDKNTNVTVDTIANYDSVIMNKADVEFFAKLVDGQELNINDSQNVQSAKVSKILADMLAKSMHDNKPIRIDFDNNISVIIKIGRDGKISADFLPSSQIAEAYLRENLPILRQRFDDNNIEYGELNQRRQKQDNEDNRKKGRKDE
ncbi:hypothetical protein IJ750_05520 [bacterium]|nr:hypothetical protein [bacterium]